MIVLNIQIYINIPISPTEVGYEVRKVGGRENGKLPKNKKEKEKTPPRPKGTMEKAVSIF